MVRIIVIAAGALALTAGVLSVRAHSASDEADCSVARRDDFEASDRCLDAIGSLAGQMKVDCTADGLAGGADPTLRDRCVTAATRHQRLLDLLLAAEARRDRCGTSKLPDGWRPDLPAPPTGYWRDNPCDPILRREPSAVGISDEEEVQCSKYAYWQGGPNGEHQQRTYDDCILLRSRAAAQRRQ